MASPSGSARPTPAPSAAPTAPARRRQRSTRLVVAVALLVVGVLGVAAAVVSGSWLVATLAAVVAVVLGVSATRITYTEVIDTRRAWARDRADQAQAFAALTHARTTENALYIAETSGRLARHGATIVRLETRLGAAADEVAAARRDLAAEQARVLAVQAASADELRRVAARLEDAEERSAMAVVQVAELELELDAAQAELVAWQSTGAALRRKRA